MSWAPIRSANAELEAGLTDGKYKKVIRDRGGFPEAATFRARRDLDDTWHGIHEAPVKIRPDGRPAIRDPYFVPTPPAHLP
jgi:hypothetical protein